MEVLLFGGTAEGRELARWLLDQKIPTLVCVATDYGETLLPPQAEAHVGRMDRGEMEALMTSRPFTHVVDATHPYAARVTAAVHAAAEGAGLPLLRLVRDGDVEGDWLRAADMEQAARMAGAIPGNILLTTGSKDLHHFARPGQVERRIPRVLPSPPSLARCLELGFDPARIVCIQGPFSAELNRAMLEQYNAKLLVTKASGGAGGFWEKVEAARQTGCALLVVDRPLREEGLTLEEVQEYLEREAERP